MDWFGLSAPILQAPIGSSATVQLAEAVGRAGGLGSLAMTWKAEDEGKKQIAQLEAANVPYFLNFVLRFGTDSFHRFYKPGIPGVTFSWGIDRQAVATARKSSTKVGIQVGSVAGARRAIAAGADFVIAQGFEAGGHVQSTTPLAHLLPQVVAAAGDLPVIAAGGLARAEDIAAVLKMGAQSVMLGTRFLVAHEADSHEFHRSAIIQARATDTSLTTCFDIDWPYALHRVLRNSTLENWEAAGCPATPHRPGEGDVIGHHNGQPIIRYSDTPPFANATGDVLAACLYAGTGVEFIDSVSSAAQIVDKLWAETRILL